MAGQILARFVRLVGRANETTSRGITWPTLLMVLAAVAAFPSPATWLPKALFN